MYKKAMCLAVLASLSADAKLLTFDQLVQSNKHLSEWYNAEDLATTSSDTVVV